jgi:hypothetical protein
VLRYRDVHRPDAGRRNSAPTALRFAGHARLVGVMHVVCRMLPSGESFNILRRTSQAPPSSQAGANPFPPVRNREQQARCPFLYSSTSWDHGCDLHFRRGLVAPHTSRSAPPLRSSQSTRPIGIGGMGRAACPPAEWWAVAGSRGLAHLRPDLAKTCASSIPKRTGGDPAFRACCR